MGYTSDQIYFDNGLKPPRFDPKGHAPMTPAERYKQKQRRRALDAELRGYGDALFNAVHNEQKHRTLPLPDPQAKQAPVPVHVENGPPPEPDPMLTMAVTRAAFRRVKKVEAERKD